MQKTKGQMLTGVFCGLVLWAFFLFGGQPDIAWGWFGGAVVCGLIWYGIHRWQYRHIPRIRYEPPKEPSGPPRQPRPPMADPRSNRLIIPPREQ